MPVKIAMDNAKLIKFFATFGVQARAYTIQLLNSDAKFSINFHTVDVTHQGKNYSLTLPQNTTKYMNGGPVNPNDSALMVNFLGKIIDQHWGAISPEGAVGTFLGMPVTTEAEKAAALSTIQNLVGGETAKVVAPEGPILLKYATALGQVVKGTANNYRVVALSPTMKMAVKHPTSYALSVRVEGTPTPKEREALIELGFTDNGSYLSTHFTLSKNCEAHRVIGVLFFHPSLKFSEKVSSLEEIQA